MSEPEEKAPEDEWPSMVRAYDFVLPSYQWLLSRCEAADNRLSALLTVVTTAMFAFPVLARSIRPNAVLDTPVFFVGVGLLVLASVIGIWARIYGKLNLADPAFLFGATHETDFEFRKNAVFFAGKHLGLNRDVVAVKHKAAAVMSGLLLLGTVVLVRWLSLA